MIRVESKRMKLLAHMRKKQILNIKRDVSSTEDAKDCFNARLCKDVSLLCLARLPRLTIYQLAVVSKEWGKLLRSLDLYNVRRLLDIREEWMIVRDVYTERLRVFSPASGDSVLLPHHQHVPYYQGDPCLFYDYVHSSRYVKHNPYASLTSFDLNIYDISWEGWSGEGWSWNRESWSGEGWSPDAKLTIWKFDTVKLVWSEILGATKPSIKYLLLSVDRYAYFAGDTTPVGTTEMWSGYRKVKGLERYDYETNLWEQLSGELNHNRVCCSAFILDGKFHVIGGYKPFRRRSGDPIVAVNSAEAYDFRTRKWTVIEGMWPFLSSHWPEAPVVEVLNNELYAIDRTRPELYALDKTRIMFYIREKSIWHMLVKLPFEMAEWVATLVHNDGYDHRRPEVRLELTLKAVGDELFITVSDENGSSMMVYAYRPSKVPENRGWRTVGREMLRDLVTGHHKSTVMVG